MPKGKSRSNSKKAGEHLPPLVDLQFIGSLNHVLRQHIVLATVQGEASPNEMSQALGEELSQISYHVHVLKDSGIIEETRTEPRRGAVEHYYRATAKTLIPAKAWRGLKKGLRAVVGAGQASDLFNDLAGALKAGKLQGDQDLIARTPLVLDAEGKRNVAAMARKATKEVESEQRATAKRMAKANGDGGEVVGYTFAVLAFDAAWQPADLHALAAGDIEATSTNGANGAGRKRRRKQDEGRKAR
jgi:DNA-binding transcriptional ArsR family regulator